MKILENGLLTKGCDTFLIGKVVTCYNCKCKFKIEKGDRFSKPYLSLGRFSMRIYCPECDTSNQVCQ